MKLIKFFISYTIYFVIIFGLAKITFAGPGTHSVTLSWQDTDGTVVSYNLYRGPVTGVCSGTPTPYIKGITNKSYVDIAVTAGTTYVYAVSAVNGAGGESTCSSEVQVTVPSSPVAPTNLQGVAN